MTLTDMQSDWDIHFSPWPKELSFSSQGWGPGMRLAWTWHCNTEKHPGLHSHGKKPRIYTWYYIISHCYTTGIHNDSLLTWWHFLYINQNSKHPACLSPPKLASCVSESCHVVANFTIKSVFSYTSKSVSNTPTNRYVCIHKQKASLVPRHALSFSMLHTEKWKRTRLPKGPA